MATIYLPDSYVDNCNVVYDGFIRSYTDNSYTTYYDIYPNMNYAVKEGFNTSESVICDNLNTYTSEIYYRFDLANSLIIMIILGLIMFGGPLILYTRLFRRFKLWKVF